MSNDPQIPVLTDLIEKGIEITLSDLGLDDDPQVRSIKSVDGNTEIDITEIEITEPDVGRDPLLDNPALEQAIRRILDEHMELAWQEIRLAIARELDKDA